MSLSDVLLVTCSPLSEIVIPLLSQRVELVEEEETDNADIGSYAIEHSYMCIKIIKN